VQLFDLRELNLLMFVPAAESVSPGARELCDVAHAARGRVWREPRAACPF